MQGSIQRLRLAANTIRQDIIRMLVEAKSGHTAGPLGMADIFAALYMQVAQVDPKNPRWDGRDRIILSNGHICPVLYATLAERGFFDKKTLVTLRKLGSPLQGHPHLGALPGVENSSGPLGQGLSQACGMALAARLDRKTHVVFCLTSDGEQQEGQTWEAAMLAAKYKLGNLVQIMDRNHIQIDGRTDDIMPLGDLGAKYRAFGWEVVEIPGNDMEAVLAALTDAAQRARSGAAHQPILILANTIPGKGVSFFENDYKWHGVAPKPDVAEKALAELRAERARLEAN